MNNRERINVTDFIQYLTIKVGLSKSSIVGYKSRITILQQWLEQQDLKLDKGSIEQFLFERKGTDGYINTYIYFLKHLEAYLKDRGTIIDLSAGFRTRKVERPPIQIITAEQAKHLITYQMQYVINSDTLIRQDRVNLILTKFLYLTCCRISEALELNIGYVDLGGGWVTFTHTKGKKFRRVPISEPLLSDLQFLISGRGNNEPVFINRYGRRVDKVSFQYNLKRRAVEADIELDIHPHILRHSGASHLIEAGVPIEIVSNLLGHAELNTTMETYIHIKNDQLRDAMGRLPFYQENTHPSEIIKHLLEVIKGFKLQDDKRFNFKILEDNKSLSLKLVAI